MAERTRALEGAPTTRIYIGDCTECGAVFVRPVKGGRNPTVCSRTCRFRRNRRQKGPEGRAAAAARYRANRAQRQRFTCEWCGAEFGRWKPSTYCSAECQSAGLSSKRRINYPRSKIHFVDCSCGCGDFRVLPFARKAWRCSPTPPAPQPERACDSCGGVFVVAKCQAGQQRFCSKTCRLREFRGRRRAQKRKVPTMALVVRAKIYERDGWRCQICRRLVKRGAMPPHPKAPTLDHIIPLAQGGTHEPANCQLACFRCNCLKGDRTAPAGDQLRLIG